MNNKDSHTTNQSSSIKIYNKLIEKYTENEILNKEKELMRKAKDL